MSDGIQQALNYARMMNVPFVFSSNGDGFVFHNQAIGMLGRETLISIAQQVFIYKRKASFN
ncbi:MAG: hypothetical protein IJO14_12650 [Clostridia bacterium]|nr:hypothetical protein [Clostridia bacterium]